MVTWETYVGLAGLSYILTSSRLLECWRNLFKFNSTLFYLVKCPVCTGFWVGLAAFAFIGSSNTSELFPFVVSVISGAVTFGLKALEAWGYSYEEEV